MIRYYDEDCIVLIRLVTMILKGEYWRENVMYTTIFTILFTPIDCYWLFFKIKKSKNTNKRTTLLRHSQQKTKNKKKKNNNNNNSFTFSHGKKVLVLYENNCQVVILCRIRELWQKIVNLFVVLETLILWIRYWHYFLSSIINNSSSQYLWNILGLFGKQTPTYIFSF